MGERRPTMRYQFVPDDWYQLDESCSDLMLFLFKPTTCDDETLFFLEKSARDAENACLQMTRTLFTSILSLSLSKPTINGLVGCGKAHLFSANQMKTFLAPEETSPNKNRTLLDLGAGDGSVTMELDYLYKTIYATEESKVLQWKLQNKGIILLGKDEWTNSDIKFDLITAFNLLDCHEDPRSLLRDMRFLALRCNACIVISIVLPFRGLAGNYSRVDYRNPGSKLKLTGTTFEEQVDSFVCSELTNLGMEVMYWTKIPYFVEGDSDEYYYQYDSAMFYIRPMSDEEINDAIAAVEFEQHNMFSFQQGEDEEEEEEEEIGSEKHQEVERD